MNPAMIDRFSEDAYRSIIAEFLRCGYRVRPFTCGPSTDGKTLYLRHDVDISMEQARRVAEWNASLGVIGTFCVLVRSPHYNLLADDELMHAAEIIRLGQRLGLHYAAPREPLGSSAKLRASVEEQFAIACRALGAMDPVFAWHNTTPEIIALGETTSFGGLLNAYGTKFFRDIAYYSDTHLRYTPSEWRNIARRSDHVVQALFHPIVWTSNAETAAELWSFALAALLRRHDADLRNNHRYRATFTDGVPPELQNTIISAIRDGS